jgi:hypothetical protein
MYVCETASMTGNGGMSFAAWSAYAGCLALTMACTLTPPLPEGESMTEGQKNLAAIRTILSNHPFSHSEGLRQERSPISTAAVWPPDWLAALASSAYANQDLPDQSVPYVGRPSARMSPGRSSARDFRVTIPWKPPVPAPPLADEPFRPVPPYFHPSPAVSTYPGVPRCVPDFSGGQRCR